MIRVASIGWAALAFTLTLIGMHPKAAAAHAVILLLLWASDRGFSETVAHSGKSH